MFIQYIITFFALFAVYRAALRLKDKTISKREFGFWSFFWLIVIGATLAPKDLDRVAKFVGVGRGVDVAIYISIIVIFYLIFRILVRLDKIDKDMTQIVRKVALNNNNQSNLDKKESIDK